MLRKIFGGKEYWTKTRKRDLGLVLLWILMTMMLCAIYCRANSELFKLIMFVGCMMCATDRFTEWIAKGD